MARVYKGFVLLDDLALLGDLILLVIGGLSIGNNVVAKVLGIITTGQYGK